LSFQDQDQHQQHHFHQQQRQVRLQQQQDLQLQQLQLLDHSGITNSSSPSYPSNTNHFAPRFTSPHAPPLSSMSSL
ncbi:hypothetical protein BGZ93_000308, partial [Podila epicladia]